LSLPLSHCFVRCFQTAEGEQQRFQTTFSHLTIIQNEVLCCCSDQFALERNKSQSMDVTFIIPTIFIIPTTNGAWLPFAVITIYCIIVVIILPAHDFHLEKDGSSSDGFGHESRTVAGRIKTRHCGLLRSFQ